ncbi:GerAB/ArcD/ProY family transporter [Neobacillus dielmonensis]|uniref:GerAB/ArcD/ProY family transporter n=1 Tax=Neobacillus dielmonensis TaxID=1347369 RepID=UPI0005A86D5A|nr:endospore germination permease [Neobacillus dielmonensis]
MKQKISNLQVMFLVANFIVSATVISLPQITVHIGGQSAWIVPLMILPILILIVYLLFGKKKHAESLRELFMVEKHSSFWEKGFLFFFLLFLLLTFIRDLRAMIDFVASVLLPSTPISVIMILTVLGITYVAMAGLEVTARINAIYFVILGFVIVILPIIMLNEADVRNFQPLPTFHTALSLIKSVYFTFSWLGEMLIILIVVGNINPIKAARSAVLWGAIIGTGLFLIVIVMQIAVLGKKIVMEATFPSYILIQQINLTDFLDRLDLVIVAVWVPTLITKAAFLLYGINHCFSIFYKSNTNKFLFPFAFILGYISILIFKNSMEHIHYSFYTWSSLGLILEVILIGMFLIIKRKSRKNLEGPGRPVL